MRGTKLALALGMVLACGVVEGQLAPPAGPTSADSAKYTLGDIYNRLYAGTVGTKRAGVFVEPTAGPTAATMNTTDAIMGVAPSADNTNGATVADVVKDKTFWGLRTDGTWGLKSGTLVAGSAAGVPKTGQTVCYKYVAPNWVLDDGCATNTPAGQDGALKKGVAYPSPRFTKNGNGTVTDNLTGLIWLENANCTETVGGISKASGTLTWVDAMNWSKELYGTGAGACGLTDGSTAGQWRVPNYREQLSLIDINYFNPAVPNTLGTGKWTQTADSPPVGDPFTKVQSSYYWTSSTYVGVPAHAWYVDVYYGNVSHYAKINLYYVWPVRGGQ